MQILTMSENNKLMSGFKFSFKKQQKSAQCTPKFTSIQLQPGSIKNTPENNVINIQQQNKTHNKLQLFSSSARKNKKIKIHLLQSPKSLHFHTQADAYNDKKQIQCQNYKYQKLEYLGKRPHSHQRDRNIIEFKQSIKSSQNYKDLKSSQKSLPNSKQITKLKNKTLYNQKYSSKSTYLQIFRRQKSETKQKMTQNQFGIKDQQKFKRHESLLHLNDSKSPKSVKFIQKLYKNKPKRIQTNLASFFQNIKDNQFMVDTKIFPQTQKSRKFLKDDEQRTQKMNQFFRKNQLKNLGVSKKLVKPQNSNLMSKISNMGAGISKFNFKYE